MAKGKVFGLPTPALVLGGLAVVGSGVYFYLHRSKAQSTAPAADTTPATAPYGLATGGGGVDPAVLAALLSSSGTGTTSTSTTPATATTTPTTTTTTVPTVSQVPVPLAAQLAAEDPTSSQVTSVTNTPAEAQQLASNNAGAYQQAVSATSQQYINDYETWAAKLTAFNAGSPSAAQRTAWLAANPAPQPTAAAA